MDELTEYFRRHYTLILDNDQYSYELAREIAREAVVNEMPTMSEYRVMSLGERSDNYAVAIGEAILEAVYELIVEALGDHNSLASMMVREILPNWSELAGALGEHYMPETEDMEGLLDEDDEDEEE